MQARLLWVIYIAFVSLGLPDTVLGVAWPSMRTELSLGLEVAGLLAMVTTLGTALSSFAYGGLAARVGTGPIVSASVLLTAIALLGYGASGSLAWLVVFAVPLGLGAGAVDTGLNSYVAQHYSSRHMNWLHASWGIGAFLGPTCMSLAIAAPGWRTGFFVIGLVQLCVATLLAVSWPLWKRGSTASSDEVSPATSRRTPRTGAPRGGRFACRC